MVLLALALVALGLVVSLLGFKLFNVILPVVGLFAGTVIGFTGFQGIFGKGVISTTVAVFVAVVVGVVMAILSYAFFGVAVMVLSALVGAALFGYLGVALGLNSQGFLVFMLSLTGFIIGLVVASSATMTAEFVITFTSLIGVAFILAGVFLLAGHLTVDQLNNDGIVPSIVKVVDQSFLWLFVWLAGSMIARGIQVRTVVMSVLNDTFEYNPKQLK